MGVVVACRKVVARQQRCFCVGDAEVGRSSVHNIPETAVMPANGSRNTVTARQEELEGRVTGLERDVQHAIHMVEQTNRTVTEGFVETRRMIEQSQHAFQESSGKLHTRITEVHEQALKKSQVSWPLAVSVVLCALAVGGIFVSFVNMTTAPLGKNVEELRISVEDDLVRERATRAALDRLDEQVEDAQGELAALRGDKSRNTAWHLEIVQRLTRLETEVACLEKTQDRAVAYLPIFAENKGRVDAMIAAIREVLSGVLQPQPPIALPHPPMPHK